MDTESPTHEPTPVTGKRRPSALTGALLGVVALTASVVGVSAIAGAQDEPTTDAEPAGAEVDGDIDEMEHDGDFDDIDLEDGDMFGDFDDAEWAAFDECIDGALGGIDEPAEDAELSDADWEALEAQFEAAEAECGDLLPAEVQEEIAAWAPFEECLDNQLGTVDFDEDADLTDEDWVALDAQFEAAEEACGDLLPEDIQAEMAAFEAFDQCLTDAGFGEGDFDGGPVVHIDTGDGGQIIEFGEAAGTVTITGDANGISVDSSGVTVIDEGEIDAAFEACEQLLPEDILDWDEGEWDEGDLDEGHLDEGDMDDEGDDA